MGELLYAHVVFAASSGFLRPRHNSSAQNKRQLGDAPPTKGAWSCEQSGFVDVVIGPAVDTLGGAGGESKARLFEVFGYAFLAHKPK